MMRLELCTKDIFASEQAFSQRDEFATSEAVGREGRVLAVYDVVGELVEGERGAVDDVLGWWCGGDG